MSYVPMPDTLPDRAFKYLRGRGRVLSSALCKAIGVEQKQLNVRLATARAAGALCAERSADGREFVWWLPDKLDGKPWAMPELKCREGSVGQRAMAVLYEHGPLSEEQLALKGEIDRDELPALVAFPIKQGAIVVMEDRDKARRYRLSTQTWDGKAAAPTNGGVNDFGSRVATTGSAELPREDRTQPNAAAQQIPDGASHGAATASAHTSAAPAAPKPAVTANEVLAIIERGRRAPINQEAEPVFALFSDGRFLIDIGEPLLLSAAHTDAMLRYIGRFLEAKA